jgi:hypothetical protein
VKSQVKFRNFLAKAPEESALDDNDCPAKSEINVSFRRDFQDLQQKA